MIISGSMLHTVGWNMTLFLKQYPEELRPFDGGGVVGPLRPRVNFSTTLSASPSLSEGSGVGGAGVVVGGLTLVGGGELVVRAGAGVLSSEVSASVGACWEGKGGCVTGAIGVVDASTSLTPAVEASLMSTCTRGANITDRAIMLTSTDRMAQRLTIKTSRKGWTNRNHN